jgi:hypothetical protein
MKLSIVAAVLWLAPRLAAAEGPLATPSLVERAQTERVAFAVNPPVGWLVGSFAGSVYVGLGEHHALRANLARYPHSIGALGAFAEIVAHAEYEATQKGDITDLGLAWMIFPDRLCSGLIFELGLLGRFRNFSDEDEYHSPPYVALDTTTIAGRALIGWSWRFGNAFLSYEIGASVGREFGTETDGDGRIPPMMTTHHIYRQDVEFESFLRLGLVFGQ